MELSFAVGNMMGAAECVKEDYRQLQDILNAWECSKRGDTKKELDVMRDVVSRAVALGGPRRQAIPQNFCQDLWYAHNRLVKATNIFDEENLGLGLRGPVPPVVKGPDGVAVTRTLKEMQSAWPTEAPTVAEEQIEVEASTATPRQGRRAASGGAEAAARYGKKEERWYPQRLAR
tara:strand:- start:456 stop:980 length:525 start_codon:yes stop_codon:yes gene_type:complete